MVEGIEGAAGGQPGQGDISVEILEDGPILRAKITGLQADPKLAEIKDVSCPNCGTVISLEDQTDRGTELPEQSTPDIPKPFEWKNRQEVRHLQGKLEEVSRKEANMQAVLGRLVAVRNDCKKLESKSYAHSHRVVLESLFKCSKNGGQAGCPHLQGKLEEAIREEQDVQDVPGPLLAACRNHCKQLEARLYTRSHRIVLERLVKWVERD